MAAPKAAANKAKAVRKSSPVAGNCRIAKPKAAKTPKSKAANEAGLANIKQEAVSPPAILKKARKPVPSEKPKASPAKGPSSAERMRSLSPKANARKPPTKVADDKVAKRATKKKAKETYWPYTHIPPRQDERRKNGRQEGRNLVTWTRPRMVDKLVLHMQYELARHKIDVPWDVIAHRMHPGTSGSAVLQHFNRMRATLLAEGHLIPPPLPKPGSRQPVNPLIRGHVRKYPDGSDITTMRPVPYTEPMDDLKINIPYSYDDLLAVIDKKGKGKSTARDGRVSKTPSSRRVAKEVTPDPADLDSDADYDPSLKSPGKRQKTSRSKASKYIKKEMEEMEELEEIEEFEEPEISEAGEEVYDGDLEEEDDEDEEEELDEEMSGNDVSDSDSEGGARLDEEGTPSYESEDESQPASYAEEAFAQDNLSGSLEGSNSVDSISEASIDGAVNALYSPDNFVVPGNGSELAPPCAPGYVTPEMLQDKTTTYNTSALYSPLTTPSTSHEDPAPLPRKEPRVFSHPEAGNAFLPDFQTPVPPLPMSGLSGIYGGGILAEQEADADYFSQFTNLDCASEFDTFINMPPDSHP